MRRRHPEFPGDRVAIMWPMIRRVPRVRAGGASPSGISGSWTGPAGDEPLDAAARSCPAGIVCGSALGSLVLSFVLRYKAFHSVTLSPVVIVVVSSLNRATRRLAFTVLIFVTLARGIVPLVAAAACVGIIALTGVGTRLPATVIPLAEQGVFPALAPRGLVDSPRDGTVFGRCGIRSGSGCAWPSSGLAALLLAPDPTLMT